jgi:Zn-dependent protease with chaperone function
MGGPISTDTPSQTPALADLHAGFRAPWTPIRRSPAFTLGLFLVAAASLLIPLAYAAIILLSAWGLWEYLRWSISPAAPWRGLLAVPVLISVILGFIALLFLLKPLFAPAPRDRERFPLHPKEQPTLYAFVHAVCDTIGAPRPSAIEVIAQPNAAASFRRGLLSILLPADLSLTIGMSLVAGMPLDQFAGVLAHELGHFSQGAGMRASYLIRRINHWLHRCVHEPDQWDLHLRFAIDNTFNIAWLAILHAVRLLVALGRLPLRGLLVLSNALSGWFARQMEFDADDHETRFAGSACFADTTLTLLRLTRAERSAIAQVRDFAHARQLPDNFPALVALAASSLSGEDRDAIRRETERTDSDWFDSHPPTGERLRRAAAAAEPGIFRLDLPASALFSDFDLACRRATIAYYEEHLSPRTLAQCERTPVASLPRAPAEPGTSANAPADASNPLVAFLGFEPPAWRPLFLPFEVPHPADDPKAAVAHLRRVLTAHPAAVAAARDSDAQCRAADLDLARADQAAAAFTLGLSPRTVRKLTDAPFAGLAEARRARDDAAARLDAAVQRLQPLADLSASRLALSLRVLAHPAADRIPDAPRLRARAAELCRTLAALKAVHSRVTDIRAGLLREGAAFLAHLDPRRHEQGLRAAKRLAERLRGLLQDVRRDAGGVPYPFPLPGEPKSLGARLVSDTPPFGDLSGIFAVAGELVDLFPREHRRVVAELASIAAAVEAALRLAPPASTASAGPPTGTSRPPPGSAAPAPSKKPAPPR